MEVESRFAKFLVDLVIILFDLFIGRIDLERQLQVYFRFLEVLQACL